VEQLMLLAGMSSSDVLRVAVQAGFTTVILDCEHGFPVGRPVLEALMAVESAGGACLVRVAPHQRVTLGVLADSGVHGIVLSGVESLDEVEDACARLTPVPDGSRSVNPFTAVTVPAGDVAVLRERAASLSLWTMAETPAFLTELASLEPEAMSSNLRQLWRGVLIGPYDLASSQGHECSPDNEPLVKQMIEVTENASRLSLRAGLFARDPVALQQWLARGIRVDTVICGYDRDLWATTCAVRVTETVAALGGRP
jgi:4-hydroxy-2-oxoheptanedioate aldolase